MLYSAADNWDRHWSGFGEASSQSPSTRYRTRLILDLLELERPYGGAHLFELGSGNGEFAEAFCRAYPDIPYTGFELSTAGVSFSRRRVPSGRFLERNLLLPVPERDLTGPLATHAVCSEVLEHLDEPLALLKNSSQYLQPGCRVVVTVPAGPMPEFYRHIGHRRHYTRAAFRRLLEDAGYRVERLYAAGFPFFNLFRILLSLRGKHLIEDVVKGSANAPWHVRTGGALFDAMFRLNLMRWGWQLIAVCRWPG